MNCLEGANERQKNWRPRGVMSVRLLEPAPTDALMIAEPSNSKSAYFLLLSLLPRYAPSVNFPQFGIRVIW